MCLLRAGFVFKAYFLILRFCLDSVDLSCLPSFFNPLSPLISRVFSKPLLSVICSFSGFAFGLDCGLETWMQNEIKHNEDHRHIQYNPGLHQVLFSTRVSTVPAHPKNENPTSKERDVKNPGQHWTYHRFITSCVPRYGSVHSCLCRLS